MKISGLKNAGFWALFKPLRNFHVNYSTRPLDVCQPDGSGIAFCGELRGQSEAPVLFISDRGDKKRIVESLKMGDGCVTRPFDGDELAARVTALLRRTGMNRHACRSAR